MAPPARAPSDPSLGAARLPGRCRLLRPPLKGLSSPRSARNGNLLGVAGAILAVVVTFLVEDVDNLGWIIGAMAIGTVIGAVFARRVAMTAMPQLVALFNGVGGGSGRPGRAARGSRSRYRGRAWRASRSRR